MKAYFEYKDGSFWALLTEANAYVTAHGNKYGEFYPETLLKVGTEDAEHWALPPNAERTTFTNAEEAENAAAVLTEEKAKDAFILDEAAWRAVVECNPCRIFFVPGLAICAGGA